MTHINFQPLKNIKQNKNIPECSHSFTEKNVQGDTAKCFYFSSHHA